MKIEDLVELFGKTRIEIEEMLKKNDIIELNLSERKSRHIKDEEDFKIFE